MPWLLRDGEVLASAEVATTRAARRRGLLGRPAVDGVLVLERCRQVHTFGMKYPIDVVFCDRQNRVLRVVTLKPGRVSRPVLRARRVVEAQGGAAARWGVVVGDVLELVEDDLP